MRRRQGAPRIWRDRRKAMGPCRTGYRGGNPMLILALISSVVLVVWMGFFMMGSLPLLILKHDTPVDSRFIRGLFNVYYMAIMATGIVGAASAAIAGRAAAALGLG